MKKLALPLVIIALFSVLSIVPVFAHTQESPQINDLYATRQMFVVGIVKTWNDGTNLHVIYRANSPWVLEEVHVAVANSEGYADGVPPDAIPQTKSGNPKVGKFAYKSEGLGGITTIEFTIPLSEIAGGAVADDRLAIAAHAVVRSPCGEETAWANCGTPKGYFQGSNWAVFYYYTVQ